MASASSAEPAVGTAEPSYLPATVQGAVKILVTGPFGVGKTTLVGALSEITPLRTEEVMTTAGVGVDDLTGRLDKTTTTVALDFGRITLNPQLALYLFGTPASSGSGRSGRTSRAARSGLSPWWTPAAWTRASTSWGSWRSSGSRSRSPSTSSPIPEHPEDDLQVALDLLPDVPILRCDARDRQAAYDVLIDFVDHLLSTAVLELQR